MNFKYIVLPSNSSNLLIYTYLIINHLIREDPGQPHWYDAVFANEQVESFVSRALQGERDGALATVTTSRTFTLTVAAPADSGPLHGWSIHRLLVPGR